MKMIVLAAATWSSLALPRTLHAEPAAPPPAAHHDATQVDPSSEQHGHRLALLGLSLASLQGREDDRSGTAWAVLLSATSHSLGTRSGLTLRSDEYAALGGGRAGLASELELSTTIGYRLSLGRYHGPVLRGGVDIFSAWSDWFAFDLPQIELGYQVLTPELWFDGGARGSFTVGFGELVQNGPSRSAWATRPDAGAYLRTGIPGLELTFDARFMQKNSDRSDLPFALIQADLCSARGVAVCTRFMHMAAEAHHAGGSTREQSWNVVQLVLGIGLHAGG